MLSLSARTPVGIERESARPVLDDQRGEGGEYEDCGPGQGADVQRVGYRARERRVNGGAVSAGRSFFGSLLTIIA
jgi:hypothetical protein